MSCVKLCNNLILFPCSNAMTLDMAIVVLPELYQLLQSEKKL